jgi:hypothetical protein
LSKLAVRRRGRPRTRRPGARARRRTGSWPVVSQQGRGMSPNARGAGLGLWVIGGNHTGRRFVLMRSPRPLFAHRGRPEVDVKRSFWRWKSQSGGFRRFAIRWYRDRSLNEGSNVMALCQRRSVHQRLRRTSGDWCDFAEGALILLALCRRLSPNRSGG